MISKDETRRQRAGDELTKREVHYCQSILVSELLAKGFLELEDIKNLRRTPEELNEDYPEGYGTDEEEAEKEIFEWWIVSDWLLNRLEERGEPILRTDYGDWWGRTCSGQAISLDCVIQEIALKAGF